MSARTDLTYVSKAVRDKSISTMGGNDEPTPPALQGAAVSAQAAQPEQQALQAGAAAVPAAAGAPPEKAVRRRRLYRQATSSDIAWFPHDNASDLLKELI